jgi:hypothetical protein
MDNIGFHVPDIRAFAANLDAVAKTNIQLAPRPFDPDSEGTAHLALLKKCSNGTF